MIDAYRVELTAPALPLGLGTFSPDVRRAQEWLGLNGVAVTIDGDFGPATARAVRTFQLQAPEPDLTSQVDDETWQALTRSLAIASVVQPEKTFGDTVVSMARNHLRLKAREIGGDNCGPWVRHYCRGLSVAWCQGFASTLYGDAGQLHQVEPLQLQYGPTWCLFVPTMAAGARSRGLFREGSDCLVDRPTPGSMFFLRGGQYGYLHVGIVEASHPDGTMTTIEGNTNEDGSANGYEVARRIRRIQSCDFAVLK